MKKYENLKQFIKQYKSAVIAFSGGVDSTFLAKVAINVLGRDNVLLVTATSSTYPQTEFNEAKKIAQQFNAQHKIVESEETEIDGFADNPPNRCYYCKLELYNIMNSIKKGNYDVVFDGSNFDDLDDYRPGKQALKETGAVSPLLETKMTKDEIRIVSKELNLVTANKPAFACLASRFPYGEKITQEKLGRVEKAEDALRDLGFIHFRVRSHDNLARIEFGTDDIEPAWKKRIEINNVCKNAGFIYVSIDSIGYRMGAMNESLFDNV